MGTGSNHFVTPRISSKILTRPIMLAATRNTKLCVAHIRKGFTFNVAVEHKLAYIRHSKRHGTMSDIILIFIARLLPPRENRFQFPEDQQAQSAPIVSLCGRQYTKGTCLTYEKEKSSAFALENLSVCSGPP